MSHQQVTNKHGIHKIDREEVPSRILITGETMMVEELCLVARKVSQIA